MSSGFCLFFTVFGLIWICAAYDDHEEIQIPAAEEVKIGDYPFIVSVQRRQRSYDDDEIVVRHSCAGIILAEKHILTGSYCVNMEDPHNRIMAGGLHAYEKSEEKSQQFRNVSKVTQIPKDENEDEYEDEDGGEVPARPFRRQQGILAILELETPLEFGPEIGPVSLPDNQESFPVFGKKGSCVTLGWGNLWEDPDAKLCTANEEETFRPLCIDLGSPLICEDNEGIQKAFGIDALSNPHFECEEFSIDKRLIEGAKKLYIFSEVNHFLDWIRETTSE
ncbi:unnamed protein product [Cyprideis torosa]|uniref:Uncharacterized protein n=1 Tax=Cyprideis torosa TaxID=163714 RepID=A0A7R8W5Y9_9CRUS|nr:unnamed protein product [Cyprideis torosa]CAG0885922.1 unnamed protein product [Cyprideis torosa]